MGVEVEVLHVKGRPNKETVWETWGRMLVKLSTILLALPVLLWLIVTITTHATRILGASEARAGYLFAGPGLNNLRVRAIVQTP